MQIVTDPDIGTVQALRVQALRVQALRVQDNNNVIEREADLSGLACARLSFDYRRDGLEAANELVTVEVSADGGGSWAVLDTFSGPADDPAYTGTSYDISAFAAANTRIRFSSLTAAGGMGNGDDVLFDNVQIRKCGSLGAGEDLTFRFDVTVNTGTGGQTLDNQATVSSNQTGTADTNLLSLPIDNNALVTGLVFLDIDADGVQGPLEDGVANVDVCVATPAPCAAVSAVVTDANGNYSAIVTVGLTSFDVDETDVDFPAGAVLTTGNDPQTVNAGSADATPTGYQPQGLVVAKGSSAPGNLVAPGDPLTYTVLIANNSGVTQNDVTLTDPLPAGVAYVAESTVATRTGTGNFRDNFNVTAYSNDNGSFFWATNWLETGPNDSGGSPTGGDVQIVTDPDIGSVQALRVQDNNNVIEREANLIGMTSATLRFDVRRDGLEAANELVTVEVSADGDGSWTLLDTFAGPANDVTYATQSYDISAFIAANTRIRFSSLTAAGGMGNGDDVLFDNVDISGATLVDLRTNVVSPPGGLVNGTPANVIVTGDNYDLLAGQLLTVTFQVTVDDPLAPAITSITNTATAASVETAGVSDSVVDTVMRPVVNIEPNAAGTVLASGSTQTLSFLHTITNDGDVTDSFSLVAFSERGWQLELVDPATSAVIATDSNGDGVWDGPTPNTGTLTAGASASYLLRVTVPGGTAIATVDSLELRATSDLRPGVSGSAFDELTVVDAGVPGVGDVLVTPDGSSNAVSGSSAIYTHTITNLTGATDVFDLSASSSQGWTTTVYRDTNGDGVYTAGVDTAIGNTASLAAGASQTVFVVVDVPGAAAAGSVDVTHVTARSQANPDLGGIASDTTTVGANNSVTRFDFSGGGSQVINAGDTPAYAGTLSNTGTAADTYEFTISASVYGPGGSVADGLNHASQLWVDTDADGVADTQIARDDDGDGVWDFVDPAPAFDSDSDSDGNPDVTVAAGATLVYELRRPVDAAQTPYRDPVTLTATSNASGAADSVTVTTAILLLTRAVIGGLVAYGSADGVVVQWQTTSEHGTVGFDLLRFDEGSGKYRRVNEKLLPALMHTRNGGTYRYVDSRSRVGEVVTYQLVELEATGNRLTYGPYTVAVEINAEAAGVQTAAALDRPVENFERVERALSAIQEARMAAKKRAREQARAAKLARKGPQAKIMVRQPGAYYLDSARIAQVLGRSQKSVERLIDAGGLVLLNGGKRVATLAAAGNTGLYFYGQGIDSQYTSDNVYWLAEGKGLAMASRDGRLPAAATGDTFSHTSRAEGNRYSLTHLFDDPDDDYWMWDFRFEDLIFPNYEPSYTVSSPAWRSPMVAWRISPCACTAARKPPSTSTIAPPSPSTAASSVPSSSMASRLRAPPSRCRSICSSTVTIASRSAATLPESSISQASSSSTISRSPIRAAIAPRTAAWRSPAPAIAW